MKTHPRQRPQRLKALLEAFGISVFLLLFFFSGGRKWQLSQHRIDETWGNVLFLSKTPTLIVWPLHAKLFSLVHEIEMMGFQTSELNHCGFGDC